MSKPARIPDLERDLLAAGRRIATPRSRRRPALAVLVTVVAAVAASAIALFAVPGGGPQASAQGFRSGGLRLADYFTVFRGPAQRNNPGDLFAENPRLSSFLNVDPATARRLDIPGQDVWVAASSKHVCIATAFIGANGFATACARPQQILQAGISATTRPAPTDIKRRKLQPGTTQFAAFFPDGVTSVTITLADGVERTIAVSANGVAETFPSYPRYIAFRDARGVLREHSL